MRRVSAWVLALLLLALPLSAQTYRVTLRAASGSLTAGETTSGVSTAGFTRAVVVVDITTATLPDADDEVDVYLQTTYDGSRDRKSVV